MGRFLEVSCIVFALITSLSGVSFSGETGHYISGVEGIKAGSAPPPGFYCRMYNVFYDADKLADGDGDSLGVDFDASTFAFAPRFIWVTDAKIWGGNFAAEVTIPVIYSDLEIGALQLKEDQFGLSDIFVGPFNVVWYGPFYEAGFGVGAYVPTGKCEEDNPASPGKDFWTGMLTLAGTYYLDHKKSWSATILSRYEIHGEKDGSDVRPGDDFHFEWGLAKTLARIWDLGLVGYCHWQVTDDRGFDVTWDRNVHDRVFAIGPEVNVFVPPLNYFFSLRCLQEFGATDRPEGNVFVLTATKIFATF